MSKAVKRLLRFCGKSGDRPTLKSNGVFETAPVITESKDNILPKNLDLMKKNYAESFLRKRAVAVKRQTYVSQRLHEKIAAILAVVRPDLTVPSYIDNVLEDHLERHKSEINILYDENYRKPL